MPVPLIIIKIAEWNERRLLRKLARKSLRKIKKLRENYRWSRNRRLEREYEDAKADYKFAIAELVSEKYQRLLCTNSDFTKKPKIGLQPDDKELDKISEELGEILASKKLEAYDDAKLEKIIKREMQKKNNN